MKRIVSLAAFVCVVVTGVACGHPHDRVGEHAHGTDDAHGHEHSATEDHPTVVVTRWTDRSELFLEYPVLVAGRSGRAAIHVTDVRDFTPVSEGEAVVVLSGEDGDTLEFRGGPSRPGVFVVDLSVERPGAYTMSLSIEAPGLADVHPLGSVTVYASGVPLPEGSEGVDGSIAFLKEQQWALDFGTILVAPREIRSSRIVPATVRPRPGGDARLTAPVSGRVDPDVEVPVPGRRVREGDVLARIVPRSDETVDSAGLRASRVEAEQAHRLALQERDRAARLVEERALPQRRLDEAEADVVATAARLDAASERIRHYTSLGQVIAVDGVPSTYAVRAPFDGAVTDVRFAAGVAIDAHGPLLRLLDPDRVHVVGAVPESFAFTFDGNVSGELSRDDASGVSLGAPLAVDAVIDPATRTREVHFELDNRLLRVPIGRAVSLRLSAGESTVLPAVPDSAVVDDGGRTVVYVQTGGESFERRVVRVGDAAGGFVHVLEGVEPGERVVDRGAYLVRLASMSDDAPSHGHAH